MRKMMQLSAKIVISSSLHQNVEVATHQLQRTTFPLLIYNGIQTVLSVKNANNHSMMELFLSMKDSPIVKLITMLSEDLCVLVVISQYLDDVLRQCLENFTLNILYAAFV